MKLQQGTQGIGTMIAETPQAVASLLETLWAMGQDIVLQEYIRESKGRDIRAIVVGNPRRRGHAPHRQGRASFARTCTAAGSAQGQARPALHAAPPSRRRGPWGSRSRASTCSRAPSGPKILEINSSPGLEGIERASGVDVATAIVQHAERFVRRGKGRRSKRAVDARILEAIELERTVAKVRAPRSGRTAAR